MDISSNSKCRAYYYAFAAELSITDLCTTTICGPNTQCSDGICKCLAEYQGDPYVGCRPECTLNTDCPQNRACIRNKCVDPCPGVCGQNAQCIAYNHIPMCSCPSGMTGNAFVRCLVFEGIVLQIFFILTQYSNNHFSFKCKYYYN